ncbi:MAG: glycoside hydrolase family 44 protein [Saprospiraceae bacterium]
MKKIFIFILFTLNLQAQIKITIDPTAGIKKISPYIYGRNNSFSSTNPNWTISAEEFTRIKDAGVTFFRESGGNNCTKYNWQKKLSSHPDWYNNVYTNDWDQTAKTLQKNFPQAQGMWAFQLIGKAAKTNQYNFNDWGYNQSTWWVGVNQNLNGNGIPNASGTKAAKEGDINLYLEDWPAEKTTGIIDHWFGASGIGLNKTQVQYWNMDNEPEIWNGTHDDLVPKQIPGEDFIQRYFAVAKMARQLYPAIKLVGPVVANEWQWYNWDGPVPYNGRNIPWIEYFILRCSEEQKKTGIRLLDVVDIHFYPYTSKTEELVQLHRVFFDETYVFPEANGVKNVNGSWDNSQNREYIFTRINGWLTKYFGADHGVRLGLTELGFNNQNVNATAVTYASILGEFMKHDVELCTPWSWDYGMWETLHLFTKYSKSFSVQGKSSNEELVSAYPSINGTNDTLTLIIVNRSANTTQSINIDINKFTPDQISTNRYMLNDLPKSETFYSDSKNAIKSSVVSINNRSLSFNLEPLSVSAITVTGKLEGSVGVHETSLDNQITIFPNPILHSRIIHINSNQLKIEQAELLDLYGRIITTWSTMETQNIKLPSGLTPGTYIMKFNVKESVVNKRIVLTKPI